MSIMKWSHDKFSDSTYIDLQKVIDAFRNNEFLFFFPQNFYAI